MRLLPSMLVELLAGQDDGYIFAAVKGTSSGYIQTAHRYTKPGNPNTVAQQLTRTAFKNAAAQWKSATNKTIGATTFTRATEMDEPASTIKTDQGYRGVPTDGRQIALSAMIRKAVVDDDPALFEELPQNLTTENQLIAYKANLAAGFALADVPQVDRIGFVNG